MTPNHGVRPEILVVDDTPANLFATRQVLASLDADVITAESGNDALRLLLSHHPALVIMDVQMPEMDGFATASLIRQNEETRELPIVFLTALDRSLAHRGFECGAADYICKPIDPDTLRAKVSFYLRLWRARSLLTQGAAL